MNTIQKKIFDLAQHMDIGKLTLRGIGERIGVSHPQLVKYHLHQLQKKGLLKGINNNDSIVPVKTGEMMDNEFVRIPLYGKANCGQATMVAENNLEGMLTISRSILGIKYSDALFAVQAAGNSLNMANIDGKGTSIEDGDYVIIDRKQTSPINNQYVLSIIDGLANIKKFFIDKKNNQIVLLSESTENFPPIFIHQQDFQNYMINGTVVKVIKNPNKH